MVGDGDADAVSGRAEIIAGIEQPVAALLAGHPGPLDQMAFPVEIVGEHQPVLADQLAFRGQALGVDRRAHRVEDRRRLRAIRASTAFTCAQLSSTASISGCIRKKRSIGRRLFAQG